MARVTRIALGGVNCYLVENREGYVLIDTGHPDKRTVVEAALERAGCASGDLELIVITHGDYEHAGNALYLREKFGARIAMRRDDAARLELGDWRVGFQPRSDRVSQVFSQVSRLVETGEFETFEPDIYLEDGQDLQEQGFDATVIHLPAHAGGSLAVLTPDGESSAGDPADDLGADSEGAKGLRLFIDGMSAAREILERLQGFDTGTVYPGHGKPFRLERVRAGRSPRRPTTD